MDNHYTNLPTADFLKKLKATAVEVNKELAKTLNIPQSTAITCVKPSGTVSQLVDSASGIHTRHSPYYIRTVRCDTKDPLTSFMIEKGFPNEPDVTNPTSVTVFSFPIKSPDRAVCRNDVGAIQQLEIWLLYQKHWCEHKPSVTISVKDHEWMDVGAWVYKNFDHVAGISFLPYADHVYQQAPYQDCDKKQYENLLKQMPNGVDFSAFVEDKDNTSGSQELACTGGVCELVDVTGN